MDERCSILMHQHCNFHIDDNHYSLFGDCNRNTRNRCHQWLQHMHSHCDAIDVSYPLYFLPGVFQHHQYPLIIIMMITKVKVMILMSECKYVKLLDIKKLCDVIDSFQCDKQLYIMISKHFESAFALYRIQCLIE